MVKLVRVDDRLLHGQIICAWVPFIEADTLVVASDEAAKDVLVSEIIESCGQNCINVYVKSVEETVEFLNAGTEDERVILVVGDLRDAMKIYKAGMRFSSINVGNIHHEDHGRRVTSSVIVNSEDESILDSFEALGVEIDIRDVPASEPTAYGHSKKPQA
ncbi:MAG: PTS sugar transporter subunit IIB [Thermodesulfobacteriota bacterium]